MTPAVRDRFVSPICFSSSEVNCGLVRATGQTTPTSRLPDNGEEGAHNSIPWQNNVNDKTSDSYALVTYMQVTILNKAKLNAGPSCGHFPSMNYKISIQWENFECENGK